MDDATIAALDELNRRFYDRFAAAFDASRQRPWPGWERVLTRLDPVTPLEVLDLGCGNGRLATFLAGRHAGEVRYLGLDACPALLEAARERLAEGRAGAVRAELGRFDLVSGDLAARLGERRFDLVALFGVLHHLPGESTRRRLLTEVGRRVRPGGAAALSAWRLDRQERFAPRRIPWEEYNRAGRRAGSPRPIDLEQLEEGDHLLSWGGDREHPRYCHFPGEREIAAWSAAIALPLVDRFTADGPGGGDNLYLVYERPRGS